MDKIKVKYKKGWNLIINGVKSESKSVVKEIGNFIDKMDKPQEMKFSLKVIVEFRSGQGVFEMQTCYATSDFTLPFIEELEKQVNLKKIKLEPFAGMKFPPPDTDNDIFIDNHLITRDYEVTFEGETKKFSLNALIEHFKKTKVLRKAKRIYFNSESYSMKVKIKGESKPMYKGAMYFSSDESKVYIEDFKALLQMHDTVLNTIASSAE